MDSRVHSLVLDIYDTILDESAWDRVLDQVAGLIGARGCIMFEIDTEQTRALTATHLSSAYDRSLVNEYNRVFVEQELADQSVFARHSTLGDEITVVSDEVLAKSQEELAARPNARAMAGWGIHHRAGAILSRDNPSHNRFSVQFSREHGPLNAADQGILRILLPHMAKACELARPVSSLQRASVSLSAALDRLRIGVCLIRSNRDIIAKNAEFDRQIGETGVFFRSSSGKLQMRQAEDQLWLEQLVASAGNHGRYGARPRKEALGGTGEGAEITLSVEIAPLTSADAFGETRLDGFAVYSLDTSRPIVLDIDVVSKALSLTQSEGALVDMLSQGLTNREIAERRQRSVETVNSQVKSLLSKAGCANRTQIIRRATTIGANFLMDAPHNGDARR